MSRRVDRRNERYDARLSCFDWCRGFDPGDFNGKHVAVFMSGGSIINGALTCMEAAGDGGGDFGHACDRIGLIGLGDDDPPASHDGRGAGKAACPTVLKRLRPGGGGTPPSGKRRWSFADGVEEVVFVWDEQDYDPVLPERVEPGCLAVVGSDPYPVLAVNDDYVVIDMDVPIAFRRGLIEEFLRARNPVG